VGCLGISLFTGRLTRAAAASSSNPPMGPCPAAHRGTCAKPLPMSNWRWPVRLMAKH
jgi:hypothetical protein